MQVTTKFNLGDNVWFLHKHVPICRRIASVTIAINHTETTIVYFIAPDGWMDIGSCHYHEDELFYSQDDLLNTLHIL